MSITRDTRPLDPEDQARRDQLNQLAKTLRDLHAALLKLVQHDYEQLHGPVGGPLKLFGLVTNDPFFNWLRPLSGQMVLLDERIDDKTKLEPNDLLDIKTAIEKLFEPAAKPPEAFAVNFKTRLEHEPRIAGVHAELHGRLKMLVER